MEPKEGGVGPQSIFSGEFKGKVFVWLTISGVRVQTEYARVVLFVQTIGAHQRGSPRSTGQREFQFVFRLDRVLPRGPGAIELFPIPRFALEIVHRLRFIAHAHVGKTTGVLVEGAVIISCSDRRFPQNQSYRRLVDNRLKFVR